MLGDQPADLVDRLHTAGVLADDDAVLVDEHEGRQKDRNRRDGRYSAKIGLGDNARTLLPSLGFDDAYEPNVFFASLGSDRVIFIENARDPKFSSKLPRWWKDTLAEARCFVIIPLCTRGEPVGFIYGDWDDRFPSVYLSQPELTLLNDMRGLVVKTVERRQQLEAVAGKA